jgi:hypothetical protein
MYILIRKHMLPISVDKQIVLGKYLELLKETSVLQSTWDMDFWIKTKFSYRDSIVKEETITIEFQEFKTFLNSVKHNTLVEEWAKDKKKEAKEICFKKTRLRTTCSVCLSSSGIFITIEPCMCIFHKKCIIEASKYSMMCPLCHTTIKEKKNEINAETKKKKKRRSS